MMSILWMDIRATFGGNLRRFRKKAGLSQEHLADLMGVDRAHVSSMERGQQNVTLITIWHAAQALNVAPAEFLIEAATVPEDDERRAS